MITNVKRVSRGSQAICEEQSAGAVRLRRRIIELLSDCVSKSENKRDTHRSHKINEIQKTAGISVLAVFCLNTFNKEQLWKKDVLS